MKFFIITLFIIITGFQLSVNSRQDCQRLIEQGNVQKTNKNYSEAFKSYTEAESMAKKNSWYRELCTVENQFGIIYVELSNYGKALRYYQDAWKIVQDHPELKLNSSAILSNIGNLYHKANDIDKALEYYEKAYALAKKNKNDDSRTLLALNIANFYSKKNELKKGRAYLDEVKDLPKKKRLEQGWKINYAENLYLAGETDRAEALCKPLLKEIDRKKNNEGYLFLCDLLTRIYIKTNQPNLAIEYAKRALKDNTLDQKINLYTSLSKIYFQKKQYETAWKYRDSVDFAKDSLSVRINRQLFEENKVKFDVQEYQNELKTNKKIYDAKIKIYWVVIILVLLLFFFIYSWQKNRIAKQRQERLLIDNKQHITSLELKQEKNEHLLLERKMTVLKHKSHLKQEQFKNKISQKNRELSATALYHSGRNELLEKIISALGNISAVAENKEVNNFIKTLKSHIKTDSEWKEFTNHFEKVNPGFLKNLKEKHIKLTKKDIRFLCYIYMNLSTKEICTIFSITQEAFWKRKQRLSEKMELEKGASFYDYILSLK